MQRECYTCITHALIHGMIILCSICNKMIVRYQSNEMKRKTISTLCAEQCRIILCSMNAKWTFFSVEFKLIIFGLSACILIQSQKKMNKC